MGESDEQALVQAQWEELDQKLEREWRRAFRTAVQLGWLTETIYWGAILLGAAAAGLGLLGSRRIGWHEGALEPWISFMAAASTGGMVTLKQSGLKAKAGIWFDFTIYVETLQSRLHFREPRTPDGIAAVALAYEEERMRVQTRMRDVDVETGLAKIAGRARAEAAVGSVEPRPA